MMKRFLAAVRFLTILPVPGTWGTAEDDLVGSVPFYPIIGLLLGIVAALVAYGSAHLCPPLLLSALLVVLLLAFSGGFHMDGLSDTADGFLSSRPRERILEIMKDSHIGAMGVMAIAGAMLVKAAAIASLPPQRLWQAALLMPLAGRCAIVVNMALLPPARPGGLGVLLCQRRRWLWLVALWSFAVLLGVAWYVMRMPGIAVCGAVLIVAGLFAAWCYRKIGGSTGDTFGAVCELAELVPAIVLSLA